MRVLQVAPTGPRCRSTASKLLSGPPEFVAERSPSNPLRKIPSMSGQLALTSLLADKIKILVRDPRPSRPPAQNEGIRNAGFCCRRHLQVLQRGQDGDGGPFLTRELQRAVKGSADQTSGAVPRRRANETTPSGPL